MPKILKCNQVPPFPQKDNPIHWDEADSFPIACFHPRSSEHRPKTEARLLYDKDFLYVLFSVQDRWVRSVHTQFMDPVCKDSCCELFISPDLAQGYINFELNAGGCLHASHIRDWERLPQVGFRDWSPLNESWLETLRIATTLPEVIEPEIVEPVNWQAALAIPFSLFEEHFGWEAVGRSIWQGNLYKCGDATSHPHWASWAPIGEKLNFHQPEQFSKLIFHHEKS